MNQLLSVLGSQVRMSLQDRRESGIDVALTIAQFAGTTRNVMAVTTLFSVSQVQQIVQMASEQTGIEAETIASLLPTLIPFVLQVLNTGQSQTCTDGGGNPVLSSFLDADCDGDVDIADAMTMAGRFI